MKKSILLIMILIYPFGYSFAQEQLYIDPTKSELKWFGTDVLNVGGHYGIVHFKEGHFVKTKTKITGGAFIYDCIN